MSTVGPKEQLTDAGKPPAEVKSKAPDQNVSKAK